VPQFLCRPPFGSWTFDVALSFAAADRDKARLRAEALRNRKLTVFYDEWFKVEIWGSDLIILLRDIYLNRARVRVPLISKSYVSGPYPKHELQTMLERELLKSSGSLLPVRLDQAEPPVCVPRLPFSITTKKVLKVWLISLRVDFRFSAKMSRCKQRC
jgi:hypothetical protein